MADTPTSAAQLFPWMQQFYCADMYWLVTVESLPRALFNQEADARRYFEAADAPEVGGGLHLWRLNGGHLCRPHVASKDALEVEAVQAQPASAPMGEPSIYDALPPSAMDWLTSSDPHLAATQEWQDGWDACRSRVHMRVDAAIKCAHGISGENSRATDGVDQPGGGQHG